MLKFIRSCNEKLYWERLFYALFARTKSTGAWKLLTGILSIGSMTASLFPGLLGNNEIPFGPIVCGVASVAFIFSFLLMVCRDWVKLTIYIPPVQDEAGKYRKKVSVCLRNILKPAENSAGEKRDIVLMYNANNIIGGLDDNLISQFLSKYFPDAGGESVDSSNVSAFDFQKFRGCLADKNSGVYVEDKDWNPEKLAELKNKVLSTLKDIRDEHADDNEVKKSYLAALCEPVLEWGKGTVIALKLPENPDYQYAYLLCASYYKSAPDTAPGDRSRYSAHSDIEELVRCINVVWKIAAIKHGYQLPYWRICLPLLGKGFTNHSESAMGVLWEIVRSYRKVTSAEENGIFGISLYMPRKILMQKKLDLSSVLSFLRIALLE